MIPAQRRMLDVIAGAVYLVGAAAAVSIVEGLVPAPLGAAAIGAVVAELIANRAGVRWQFEKMKVGEIARKAAVGGGVMIAATAVIVAVGAALGFATVARGAPSAALMISIARAALLGARDELVLRGIPIATAKRARLSPWTGAFYGALAGGALFVASPGVRPEAVALALVTGFVFAALYVRAGIVAAASAHAAWLLATGPLVRGELLDVDWRDAALAVGATAAGRPAWLATAVVLAAALLVVLVARRPADAATNAK